MELSEKGARIGAGGTVLLLLQDADQEHTSRDVLFVFNMVVRHLTGNRWGGGGFSNNRCKGVSLTSSNCTALKIRERQCLDNVKMDDYTFQGGIYLIRL